MSRTTIDDPTSSSHGLSDITRLTLVMSLLWLLITASDIAARVMSRYLAGRDLEPAVAFLDLLLRTSLSVLITPLLIFLLRQIRRGERLGPAAWLHFVAVVFAVAILRNAMGHVAGALVMGYPLSWHGMQMSLLRATHMHLVYFAIAGAVVLLYDDAQADLERARLRAALSASRLQQLRAQFRPHFLLNTLNTIATLVHRDPKTADNLITSLATLLRRTLDLDDVAEIPLEEELEFVRHYLTIQQVRMGARFEAIVDAEDEALQCSILPQVLQPLVENAIVHGLPHGHPTGRVRVTARIDGDAVVLQVRDSGSADPATVSRGTGLKNLEERLTTMYGGRGTLSFYKDADEFVAEVRVPAHAEGS